MCIVFYTLTHPGYKLYVIRRFIPRHFRNPIPPVQHGKNGEEWGRMKVVLMMYRILASNRDEYLDRKALPAHWHKFGPSDLPAEVHVDGHVPNGEGGEVSGNGPKEMNGMNRANSTNGTNGRDVANGQHEHDEPWVLSGRDLGAQSAGTWLGMTRDLRIGVL